MSWYGKVMMEDFKRRRAATKVKELVLAARAAERVLNETLRTEPYMDEGLREAMESIATQIGLALADVDGLPPADSVPEDGHADELPF